MADDFAVLWQLPYAEGEEAMNDSEKLALLFVCTGNAGRSQMAQALCRRRMGDAIRLESAGVDPWPQLHPMAVEMMEEPLFASRMIETIVMRGENAIPFLLKALENKRAAYWACLAIEELGEKASSTVPALVDLLDAGPEDSLKLQALLALAKIGPQAAAPAKKQVLAALGTDSSDSVLTGAAFAAGVLGFGEASARLEQTRRLHPLQREPGHGSRNCFESSGTFPYQSS